MKPPFLIRILLAAVMPLLFANCTVSSPSTRAARRPAAFQALSAEHQRLALSGKITEGMNRDGVWVAWGPANRISELSENGNRYEIWRYTGLQPVYHSSFGVGFGVSNYHGRHFRASRFDPFYDYSYTPDYIPYLAAEVKFRSGLVKSWERITE